MLQHTLLLSSFSSSSYFPSFWSAAKFFFCDPLALSVNFSASHYDVIKFELLTLSSLLKVDNDNTVVLFEKGSKNLQNDEK